MICFAPLILAGYMLTLQPNQYHTSEVDGASVEVQSCEVGLGAHGKAVSSGLLGAGLHWGWQVAQEGPWSLLVQPKAGLSYTTTPRRELPATGQFELGMGVLVGYEEWRVGLEYWHLSCANLCAPNIGLDMVGLTFGKAIW